MLIVAFVLLVLDTSRGDDGRGGFGGVVGRGSTGLGAGCHAGTFCNGTGQWSGRCYFVVVLVVMVLFTMLMLHPVMFMTKMLTVMPRLVGIMLAVVLVRVQ